MNLPKLKNTYRQLIAYMRQQSMYNRIVSRTESMIRHMIEHEGEYDSYPDYYEKFIDADGYLKANRKSVHLRHIWRIIWAFDEFDHYPNGKPLRCVEMSRGKTNLLNRNFRTFLDRDVTPALKPEIVNDTTFKNLRSLMARFLYEMQESGATTLKKITEERILSYFYVNGEQVKCLQVQRAISMIFSRIDNPECKRIKSLMPAVSRKMSEPSPMSEETVEKIKEALTSDDKDFSLRDRAIITIALYTGMRGTDISQLTLDNIDWDRDLIKIVQSKTKKRLTLPMRATVGNALFDFVKQNAAIIKCDHYLFHEIRSPSVVLSAREIGNIIDRFFKRTMILGKGNEGRIRSFRHHLASTLMKKGEDINVVRSILGHTSQSAILSYFDLNIEDTRRCGRSISEYPVNDDYFNI